MTITSRIAGQTPASADASLLESLLNQIAATIGAIPSTNPGMTTRRVKATANFGRLISASRLPASDSSERRLVLDASSSMSPRRGSMAGLKQLLQTYTDRGVSRANLIAAGERCAFQCERSEERRVGKEC